MSTTKRFLRISGTPYIYNTSDMCVFNNATDRKVVGTYFDKNLVLYNKPNPEMIALFRSHNYDVSHLDTLEEDDPNQERKVDYRKCSKIVSGLSAEYTLLYALLDENRTGSVYQWLDYLNKPPQ